MSDDKEPSSNQEKSESTKKGNKVTNLSLNPIPEESEGKRRLSNEADSLSFISMYESKAAPKTTQQDEYRTDVNTERSIDSIDALFPLTSAPYNEKTVATLQTSQANNKVSASNIIEPAKLSSGQIFKDTGDTPTSTKTGDNRRSGKSRQSLNDPNIKSEEQPPDGGLRAYSVVIGSFLINGLIFGPINSFSVLYPFLVHQLLEQGEEKPELTATLLGILTMGMSFLISPLSGVLTDMFGFRSLSFFGGTLAVAGCFLSSFVTEDVKALCFTYGIMYGVGVSFIYTPSLAILGHYFKRRLGLVNGIVCSGGSLFTIITPYIFDYILKYYSISHLFELLTVTSVIVALCCLLFKPLQPPPVDPEESVLYQLRHAINLKVWENKRYTIWVLCMPIAVFGYYVPSVLLRMFMMETFEDVNYNMPYFTMSFSSTISPLVIGVLADWPKLNTIVLQQFAFLLLGLITMTLTFVKSFSLLGVMTAGMGICDGVFVTLVGPIVCRMVGSKNAAQGIGFMLGLISIPLSMGPAVAGKIYERTNTYRMPFIFGGLTPVIGACLMMLIHMKPQEEVYYFEYR